MVWRNKEHPTPPANPDKNQRQRNGGLITLRMCTADAKDIFSNEIKVRMEFEG